ncbi:outer membrane lipoprotein-sorting protein [Thermodesulfobacteriota bacterium]
MNRRKPADQKTGFIFFDCILMKKSHEIIRIAGSLLIMGLLLLPFLSTPSHADETWDGRRIMEEVLKRHELYPYVFEEQSMILIDSAGNRDVRKVRRFSRIEEDGTVKYLLIFDNPAEIRGVALLAIRHHTGQVDSHIYLPAFGSEMISTAGNRRGGHFLGTDFAIEDLTVEVLSDFRYIRGTDHEIDKIPYFVIEAFPINVEVERSTGYGLRRHFIRQDNFFIVRTDYYDPRGRFLKQRTHHDLKRVDGDMWRNNMILMENHKEQHKSLIKVDRRVFSRDYVPPEMFTPEWLLENRHIQSAEKRLFQSADGSSEEEDDEIMNNQ